MENLKHHVVHMSTDRLLVLNNIHMYVHLVHFVRGSFCGLGEF